MVKNKKGFVSVVLFFLIIVIALAVMPIIMQNITYRAIGEHERAFFIAESGINYYIKNQLESDADWTDNLGLTKNFGGGSFTISITGPTPRKTDSIILRSTGTVSAGDVDFERTIEKTVTSRLGAFGGVMYGMGPVSIDHNGTINGNIWSSGAVTINHNDWNVTGTINEFQNNLGIPSVNWAYWQGLANAAGAGHVIDLGGTGTQTFSSNYSGFYYVNGNVSVNKNGLRGNGTIVATGNISVTGNNCTFTAASAGGPTFISGNDFTADNVNGIEITGSIYAAHNMTIRIIAAQGGEFTGSLIFGNQLVIEQANNSTFNFDPNASSLGFEGGQKEVALTGFKEF